MTAQHAPASSRTVWAVVSIVLGALGSVTALALAGKAATDVMTLVASCIVPTVSILLIGDRVGRQVDGVREQVNGRMSELIQRVPEQRRDGGEVQADENNG